MDIITPVWNFIVSLLNYGLQFLNGLNPLPKLLELITMNPAVSEGLSWASYFLYLPDFLTVLTTLLVPLGVWYGIRVILRLVKVAD